MTVPATAIGFLDQLQGIPFIKSARFKPSRHADERFDGMLALRTGQGTFNFAVQLKLSYLDRASTHALSALAALSNRKKRPFILLARYVPRLTGEQLVAADVNFIDLAGNMHMALGKQYARTILGRPETQKHDAKRPVTAAQVQLLFLFAAEPAALHSPVRQIASRAGVGKSKAAEVRQQLLEKSAVGSRTRKRPPPDVEHLLLSGYADVLRPTLLLGRFRAPDAAPQEILARLPAALGSMGVRFSLTGGPAADLLQHFYRGQDVPIFLDQWSLAIQRRLRLLPDRQGPVIVLRAFGDLVFWRSFKTLSVAHPWLIYAELMNSEDPRAHEAAEELRREFLPS